MFGTNPTIATAVRDTALNPYLDQGTGTIEAIQAQVDVLAAQMGKLTNYVIDNEFTEARRIALLTSMLSFRYKVEEIQGLLAQAGINTFKNE